MTSRPAFSPTPQLREYSLRIPEDGRDAESHIQMHLRDTAAIRAARGLAGGRGFEVWRNELCVYAVGAMPQNRSTAPKLRTTPLALVLRSRITPSGRNGLFTPLLISSAKT